MTRAIVLTGFFALLAYACSGDDAPALGGSSGAPTADSDGAPGQGGDGGATSDAAAPADDGGATPDGSDDASSGDALPFACTNAPPKSNACPAPAGTSGQASFCFRPGWSGVTAVEVYGGFGQTTDWTAPFLTLANDGTGTFTGTTALGDGTYPYLFRVHGSVDRLVKDGQYLLDQNNPQFVPHPAGAPVQRSVSAVTVPQVAAPSNHVRGKVTYKGVPQGCYAIDLEAGELLKPGGGVLSEHYTANFAESAPDGTFDFPVAPGPFGVIVRFPFLLQDAGYPDPSAMPSIGIARTGTSVNGADVTLDVVDVSYPAADYAALSPTAPSATLPVTFKLTIIPGASTASVAVISTNIAGNDPLYWSPFGTTTSITWDGTFGGTMGKAVPGKQYYWGSWQKTTPREDGGTVWTEESLLYPITFN